MTGCDEALHDAGVDGYRRHGRRRALFLAGLSLATVLALFVTLKIDLSSMSFGDMLRVLFDRDGCSDELSKESILVWDLYLPRVTAALIAGFALGLSGAAMQCVLRNPLSSPYTLGVSNAAAFGASLGILFLGGGAVLGQSAATINVDNPYIVAVSAFMWAMIATAIIILLVKTTRVSSEAMVLAGVAINSIFAAGISLLQYISNDSALSAIVFWQFGSVGKASWSQLGLIAVVLLASAAFMVWRRWDYNALDAGDDTAKSLGIDTEALRLATLTLSAVLTAVVVSFMGVIGFIGLLGPHIVKRIIGNDNRFVFPGSMLVGALILLISDCFAQNIADFTMPVGIVTSFLGGPLFLYILIRGYRGSTR